MRRVNVELRREALRELEEDVVYRNRVKQRMREGSGCAHPPLIDRKKVLQFAARSGDGRPATGPRPGSDPVAMAG
jgi:hypothetical protein